MNGFIQEIFADVIRKAEFQLSEIVQQSGQTDILVDIQGAEFSQVVAITDAEGSLEKAFLFNSSEGNSSDGSDGSSATDRSLIINSWYEW